MHLGNGTVTPMCAVYGAAATLTGLALARSLLHRAATPKPSHLAAATALVFALQALNVPVLPGVSGHLIGGFLLAWWLGAFWGFISISLVLATQSLLLADGGLAALGLNILNMGLLPCLVVYPLFKRLMAGRTERRWAVALFAWSSTVLAALACGLQIASQTGFTSSWVSLMATLLGIHALIGIVEAAITLSAIEVVRHLACEDRHTAMVAPAAILLVSLASAFGASPWPDGLEFSLHAHGVENVITGTLSRIEQLQLTLSPFTDYTLPGTLLGTAAVAGLAIALRAIQPVMAVKTWKERNA